MKRIDKYENTLMKFESIIFGKLELSAQLKMSLLSSLLFMKFSHWTFCDFYIKIPNQLEKGPYHEALFLVLM